MCFGSVHPWAYTLMEGIIFALVAAWMVRAWLGGGRLMRDGGRLAASTVVLPIVLVLALMGFEMMPLPPALLSILSPAAYETYSRALSFESAVTRAGMLKALAYAALFLLIALYPFGADGDARAEERFGRAIFSMLLATGFIAAFLGLMNWASWNGKILWFFVPLDWEGPHLAFALRATGPFVNPDHFANYLAMILPLALVAALLRIDLVPRAWASPVRMASAAIAFLVLCAIVLSLSR